MKVQISKLLNFLMSPAAVRVDSGGWRAGQSEKNPKKIISGSPKNSDKNQEVNR